MHAIPPVLQPHCFPGVPHSLVNSRLGNRDLPRVAPLPGFPFPSLSPGLPTPPARTRAHTPHAPACRSPGSTFTFGPGEDQAGGGGGTRVSSLGPRPQVLRARPRCGEGSAWLEQDTDPGLLPVLSGEARGLGTWGGRLADCNAGLGPSLRGRAAGEGSALLHREKAGGAGPAHLLCELPWLCYFPTAVASL